MPEFIIYRGNMPTVRFNRSDAAAAVASGEYRWTPLSAVKDVPIAPPPTAAEELTPEPVVVWQWEERPNDEAVNLNSATLQELVDLPGGIGIATANKIIAARPLKVLEDAIAVYKRAEWQQLYDENLIYFGDPNE